MAITGNDFKRLAVLVRTARERARTLKEPMEEPKKREYARGVADGREEIQRQLADLMGLQRGKK